MKYVWVVLMLFSCNHLRRHTESAETSNGDIATEKLDTVKYVRYDTVSKPAVFEAAFFEDYKTVMDSIPVSTYAVSIGKLKIESGRLIACDPIVMTAAKPFTQLFPTGEFPLELAIAKIEDDQRVAFARIVFSIEKPVKWEFALQAGQQPVPITGEDFYGYGVDAGIGMFIDQDARDAFVRYDDKQITVWKAVFMDRMQANYRNTWQYVFYDFGSHNLASFSTGYGDRRYATYIGYDKNGAICRLLTDFSLIDWL